MRRFLLILNVLIVLLLATVLAVADDSDVPVPGTSDDNECYPGGVLYRDENQDGCPTDWHWKAGWFLARYNRGQITRDQFPDEFESTLPDQDRDTDSIKTICHESLPSYSLCISSDQSGTWTGINPGGVGTFDYILMFIDNFEDCPDFFRGHARVGIGGASTNTLIIYGFSFAEFAELGVKIEFCTYDPN